jgi:cell division septation protein DedD
MPSGVLAQASDSSVADSVFLEAQRMAAEGRGDSARAIVQRRLDSAAVGSPAYVDALYWRAVVAATAGDAERDLRVIVVTYPASRRSADALLRLAQLEMARGENDQALQHLQRIVVEHPDSPDGGRAQFWAARVLLNRGDLRGGCARLTDASRLTPPAQVELQNQIGYLLQRCRGVDTSVAAKVAPAAPAAPAAHEPSASGKARTSASVQARASSSQGKYTVQVAAYSTKAAADRLRESLAKRGYDARIVGQVTPFRVRVGRYDTRAAADTEAQRMRAQKMSAYVTAAEHP